MTENSNIKVKDIFEREKKQTIDIKDIKKISPPASTPVQQSSSAQTRNGKIGHKVISLGSLVNQKLVHGYQKNLDELKKSHTQVAYTNNSKAAGSSFDFSLNEASRAPVAELPYSIHGVNNQQNSTFLS